MPKILGAVWLYGSPPFSLKYALTKKDLFNKKGVDVELLSFLNHQNVNIDWLYKIESGKIYPAYLTFSKKPYTVRNLKKVEIDDGVDNSMILIR